MSNLLSCLLEVRYAVVGRVDAPPLFRFTCLLYFFVASLFWAIISSVFAVFFGQYFIGNEGLFFMFFWMHFCGFTMWLRAIFTIISGVVLGNFCGNMECS